MYSFRKFLSEDAKPFTKLKHLEHVEDHIFDEGEHGYHRAVGVLSAVHDSLKSKKPVEGLKVTTKFDGSPSVVFGHHPQNGKFFVASKSAFNKNPKLNYTPEDVEANHGHAPGLVSKLKAALEHLPKVAPKRGVYQGDLMYTHDDVKAEGHRYHFTPNTITYSTPKKSPHGREVARAKLGIVIHTKYHGNNLEDMSAGFDPDVKNFKEHPHVHVIPHTMDMKKSYHSTENQKYHEHHMEFAHHVAKEGGADMFNAIKPHAEHLKIYTNETVRTGEKPSVKGYMHLLAKRGEKEVDSVKTEKAKLAKAKASQDRLNYVKDNQKHFDNAFKLHGHLQHAKDRLINSFNQSEHEFGHSIGGEEAHPEGYVAIHKGHPVKLVNRAEFSRSNFLKAR